MNYKLIYVDFEPVCRQAGLSADRQALMNAEILKTRYEFIDYSMIIGYLEIMIPYVVFETIHLGPVPIYIWGVMQAIAFIVALLVGIYLAKEKKINPEHILNLIIICLIFGFLGARIFYVIQNWGDYKNFFDIFKVWQGGMVFYGGFVVAFVAGLLYVWWKELDFWKMADIIAICMAIGLFVGRGGCFLIHDHMGVEMERAWPWGIVMEDGVVRHETSLYALLSGFIIFLILWFLRKRIKIDGILFGIFLIWYSVIRFFVIDWFRDYVIRYWDLTISQWISVAVFLIGIVILVYCYIVERKKLRN